MFDLFCGEGGSSATVAADIKVVTLLCVAIVE